MATKDIHCFVHGNVQGVFFRKFAEEKARERGLVGFAQNTADGKLEIVARGEEAKLREFINLISVGPKHAEVESIDVEWLGNDDTYASFEIR